jgi:hypothetical protein
MDWNEPALIEREYQVGLNPVAVVARLGFPRRQEEVWKCSFQLVGLKNNKIFAATGQDGLQALTIAASTIRQWLDGESNVVSHDNVPYEVVFPRYVPFAHGLDYHRQLCRVLDKEIENKEKQIEAKRAARQGSPPQT